VTRTLPIYTLLVIAYGDLNSDTVNEE